MEIACLLNPTSYNPSNIGGCRNTDIAIQQHHHHHYFTPTTTTQTTTTTTLPNNNNNNFNNNNNVVRQSLTDSNSGIRILSLLSSNRNYMDYQNQHDIHVKIEPSNESKVQTPNFVKIAKTPSDTQELVGFKKPRKSYEVSKKLEILDEKNKHGMSYVVEKYHISRSIISRWLSNIEKYRSFNKKNLKKLHKGPKASFSMEQEQQIIDKIQECKQKGEVVNGETIKNFALELSKQLNNHSFKASSGWLENFKNRHNLQLHHH
ncbi:hypothetical protein DLAC_05240 [Tieghemostelium lacteum]|uniref:HTH CENPB-type domain-containing protein n=1 Tax=Tieghemostelium lacteum TaxID=361077 RepID=A0A151ZIL6_TIELA|nr:hypothetical protein DLAC_05240 [Tieghemostelium lacteum]|eukprot:KYQ93841.1 hypothetical protein DLAC_05240 [Tieghemostelium lacteum]